MLYIITGHSRGLGRGLAEKALQEGAFVRGISRKPAEGLFHPNLSQIALDLSTEQHWQDAADFAFADLAKHDEVALIHNAGLIEPIGLTGSGNDFQAISQTIQLNVSAVMALTEAFLQNASSAKKKLVFISSGAGRKPKASWSVYCASKAAVDMYASVVAEEQQGAVAVASLAPGVIDTDMQGLIREQSEEKMPDVSRFVDMKENGLLWSTEEAAGRLLNWLNGPDFGKDVLVDLRKV